MLENRPALRHFAWLVGWAAAAIGVALWRFRVEPQIGLADARGRYGACDAG